LKVGFVGWSRGGIIAREVARQIPAAVRMVITLGSPLRRPAQAMSALSGASHRTEVRAANPERVSRLAQPIPVPSTSIYTRDGVVAWRACLEEEGGERENIEVNTTHIGLAFTRRPCG
jgi:pimeloyl-ACP methyl ester carboxylesterase